MSRRSRKSGPAITLFFFQDIIMSTSGIMMMIVLMLCLELIERQELSAAITESPTEQVEDAVAQLQLEIEELEKQLAAVSQLANSASQMSSSDRKERIEMLQAANGALMSELERLQLELGRNEQMEPQREGRRKQVRELQSAIDQAHRELTKIEKTAQEEQGEDRPLFSIANGGHRQGWIVDLSGERIRVAPIGKVAKPTVFTSSRSGLMLNRSAASEFLQWTRSSHGRSSPYYFLFVRPSGVDSFDQISESFNKSGTAYGYDLAGSQQTLLHPVRGAGE